MRGVRTWFGAESIGLLLGLAIVLIANVAIFWGTQGIVQRQFQIAGMLQDSRQVESALLAVSLAVSTRGLYDRTGSAQDWRRFEEAWAKASRDLVSVSLRLTQNRGVQSVKEQRLALLRTVDDLSSAMNGIRTADRAASADTLSTLYESYLSRSATLANLLEEERAQLQGEVEGIYGAGAASMFLAVCFFGMAYGFLQRQMRRSQNYASQLKVETLRVQQAEKIRGEFIANISHEIRTPMTAILGFGELLRTVVDSPKARVYLDGIDSSGKALLMLINDILDLSKAEAGRLDIQPKRSSPERLLSDLRQIFYSLATQKGIAFTVEAGTRLPRRCQFDEVRTRQILINLVGNAVKYTEGGQVTVTAAVSSGSRRIVFSVADSGIGIADENLSLIFEPFRQGESHNARKFGGTGLGLSISKKLTELMGGEIAVESALGKGSVFTVSLPLVEPEWGDEAEQTPEPAETRVTLESGTVLLVDDDPHNLTILSEFLSDQAVRVHRAHDAFQALALLEETRVDVLVTDIQMPGMSGIDLVSKARNLPQGRDLPVVIVSASTTASEVEERLTAPKTLLPKPFDRAAFLQTLALYLPHSQQELSRASSASGSGLADAALLSPADQRRLARYITQELQPQLNRAVAEGAMKGFAEYAATLDQASRLWSLSGLAAAADSLRRAVENLDVEQLHRGIQELKAAFDALTAAGSDT